MQRRNLLFLMTSLLLLSGCGGGSGGGDSAPRFAITDLGNQFDGVSAINNRGQIIGSSVRTGPSDSPPMVLMNPDGTLITVLPPSVGYGSPLALSEDGTVAGNYNVTGFPSNGFIWRDGVATDIGNLGGTWCMVTGMNNQNQITGYSEIANTAPGSKMHAFLWQGGQMTDLGTAGGDTSRASDINDKGEVIGIAETAVKDEHGFFLMDGFFWSGTKKQSLGTLNQGFYNYPTAMNNRGQVVGTSGNRAFLWEDGKTKDLTSKGGEADFTAPVAINEKGHVIGNTDLSVYVADANLPPENNMGRYFLYREGRAYDLQKSLPRDSGWTIRELRDINDNDQIIGSGFYQGKLRPFLLTLQP